MSLLNAPFASHTFALTQLIKQTKENDNHKITIPNGEYHIYANEAPSIPVCVANHGHNGYKTAALILEDFDGITIDGSDSLFILHGQMDFAIIKNSNNVRIQNLTVRCEDTCNFQGKVIKSAPEKVVVQLEEHPHLYQFGNKLFQKFGTEYEEMGRTLDYITATHEIRPDTGDDNFGIPFNDIKKELNGDTLTLYDVPIAPPVGDTVVFTMSRRCNQAFFMTQSTNVTLNNVTVNTCWGMAFIAQKCKNVTIEQCKITPVEDRCWSAGQDATHFVNCKGLIKICDNLFENQLDDAVNLHGIYTKVQKVLENKILVKYSHFQSVGIDIYAVGDKLQFMHPENQMPVAYAEVDKLTVYSLEYTELLLKNITGEIQEGMICENLSDNADAIIQNNVFKNNRARGMLLATRGKTEIINNHFHSGGAAIQFESDPFGWYECGGTENILIKDNFFEDCRHGTWGRAVIDVCARKETVDGFYYHKNITIINNRFTQSAVPCVAANNVENLLFENNDYTVDTPVIIAHTKACVNGNIIKAE